MSNNKFNLLLTVFLFLLFAGTIYPQINSNEQYAIALDFTPVLNTSDFYSVFGGKSGDKVKLDEEGLIHEMEFIAYPNTVFEIIESIPEGFHFIYNVTTKDYQYKSSKLYIDSRFVKVTNKKPEDRKVLLPSKDDIINNLQSLVGYPYMWGGNYADGIIKMLDYYRPKINIPEDVKSLWIMKGVDCSGLLYQVTGGYTPRNTSSLTTFGEAVEIEGKDINEIAELVLPLDLIVLKGHVIIVLDNETVIESTPKTGVHKSNLIARLNNIISERKAVNDWKSTSGSRFVIRRWYK
jgi:cell wall-associated NlpC family hydrolase